MKESVKRVEWVAQSGAKIEAVITAEKGYQDIKSQDWGDVIGRELVEYLNIKFYVNGSLFDETMYAPSVIGAGYSEKYREQARQMGVYATLTSKVSLSEEGYNLIAAAIAEAKAEVETEETIAAEVEKEEKKATEELAWAKKVIEEASKREVLSAEDEKKWRIGYNNLHNEGGSGYVPVRATREDVEAANEVIRRRG